MSDTKISVTSQKPGIAGYESFDVFSGKDGLSRDEYKAATFHATGDTSGDARFMKAADLMEGTGAELESEASAGETSSERKEESKIEG